MTDAQKVSAIKRVNERMAEIGRQFGTDSPEYERYKQAVDRVAGDYLTPAGNISHGKKAVSGIDEVELDALSRHQTAGAIKEDYRRGAEQEGITPEEYRERVNSVREKLAGDYWLASDAINAAKSNGTWKVSGRRPTYSELDAAIAKYEKMEEDARAEIRSATIARHFSGAGGDLSVGSGDRVAYGEGVSDSIQ